MEEVRDKLWHLERFNVIQTLTMKERMTLKELAIMKSYKQGEVVCLPSNASKHVFFLKSGNIKISRTTASGDEQVMDIIGPGELFGKYICNDTNEHGEIAVTLSDSLICYFDVNEWNNFIRNNVRFSMKVLKLIGLKLKRLETRIEQLQFLNISARVRTVLRELTDKHAQVVDNPHKRELKLNLTHQDIATLAGTSRQSVTTELRQLQREGIISYDRFRIIVEDYNRL